MSEVPERKISRDLVHEVRTLLGQIIGYSEMMMEQAEDTSEDGYLPHLQKVRAAGYKLLELISENFHPIPALDPPAIIALASDRTEPLWEPPVRAKGEQAGYVLIVEDAPDDREILSSRLVNSGYEVATAADGQQALEMLQKEVFDVILLDIVTPQLNGYEVLQRLQNDERLKHIPVIVISALTELESVARCIEMGADDYLTKPFNATLLNVRVASSLGKKRAHDREQRLFAEVQRNYERLRDLDEAREKA